MESINFLPRIQQGRTQGGGVQVNPPFFKLIIFIGLACMFSMQIVTAIQDT